MYIKLYIPIIRETKVDLLERVQLYLYIYVIIRRVGKSRLISSLRWRCVTRGEIFHYKKG